MDSAYTTLFVLSSSRVLCSTAAYSCRKPQSIGFSYPGMASWPLRCHTTCELQRKRSLDQLTHAEDSMNPARICIPSASFLYSSVISGFSAGYYTLNVTLGTPRKFSPPHTLPPTAGLWTHSVNLAQPFSLLLDSSSANVWVIDAACTSVACTGDSKYGVKHHQFHTE